MATAYLLKSKLKSERFIGIIVANHDFIIKGQLERKGIDKILLLDDASYSGGQLDDLVTQAGSVKNSLQILVPYATEIAVTKLTPYLLTNDSLPRLIPTWQEDMELDTDIKNQAEAQESVQKLLPTDSPPWTTYFEFKMPDWVSIATPIRTGLVNSKPPKWIKFIKNCHVLAPCPYGAYKFRNPVCANLAQRQLKLKSAKQLEESSVFKKEESQQMLLSEIKKRAGPKYQLRFELFERLVETIKPQDRQWKTLKRFIGRSTLQWIQDVKTLEEQKEHKPPPKWSTLRRLLVHELSKANKLHQQDVSTQIFGADTPSLLDFLFGLVA